MIPAIGRPRRLTIRAWENAATINGKQWGPLQARRIPLLRETEVAPLHVVQWSEGKRSPASTNSQDLLPCEMNVGAQLVVDAGRFVQAYPVLELEADEGSQLELTYSQTFFVNGKPDIGSGPGISRYAAHGESKSS